MIKRPYSPFGFFLEPFGKKAVGNATRKLTYLVKGELLPIHVIGYTVGIDIPSAIEKMNCCCHYTCLLSFL